MTRRDHCQAAKREAWMDKDHASWHIESLENIVLHYFNA